MIEQSSPRLAILATPIKTDAKIIISAIPGVDIRDDGRLDLSDILLTAEMGALRALNVSTMIAFVEDCELGAIAYEDIAGVALIHDIHVLRLPITDFGVPRADQDAEWNRIRALARTELMSGRSIAMHCLAGIGRSSMMAGNLLVYLGEPPDHALARLRSLRPDAIETAEQLHYFRGRIG